MNHREVDFVWLSPKKLRGMSSFRACVSTERMGPLHASTQRLSSTASPFIFAKDVERIHESSRQTMWYDPPSPLPLLLHLLLFSFVTDETIVCEHLHDLLQQPLQSTHA